MLATTNPPLIHFNYSETETKCGCSLCTRYRDARTSYETVREQRGRHHRFCRCAACASAKDRFVDYLAAQNRLEIYSELSYVLTSTDKPHPLAAECLRWVYGKIEDPDYRSHIWWALSSDRRLMKSWIEDFQLDWGAKHGVPANVWAVSGLCL